MPVVVILRAAPFVDLHSGIRIQSGHHRDYIARPSAAAAPAAIESFPHHLTRGGTAPTRPSFLGDSFCPLPQPAVPQSRAVPFARTPRPPILSAAAGPALPGGPGPASHREFRAP